MDLFFIIHPKLLYIIFLFREQLLSIFIVASLAFLTNFIFLTFLEWITKFYFYGCSLLISVLILDIISAFCYATSIILLSSQCAFVFTRLFIHFFAVFQKLCSIIIFSEFQPFNYFLIGSNILIFKFHFFFHFWIVSLYFLLTKEFFLHFKFSKFKLISTFIFCWESKFFLSLTVWINFIFYKLLYFLAYIC